MPLSRAFQRLVEGGLISPLPPRPPPQSTPLGYQAYLHCAYHQMVGHDTNSCATLRHVIQDLIYQGLVDLGRPGVTTNPLPTHNTKVVPPPPKGVHLNESAKDETFMMGWRGSSIDQFVCGFRLHWIYLWPVDPQAIQIESQTGFLDSLQYHQCICSMCHPWYLSFYSLRGMSPLKEMFR